MDKQDIHPKKNAENLLCPSYHCKSGSELYGIVNSRGFIDYLKATIEIDKNFVDEAYKGRDPEKRFRFAGNCVKNGCKHWSKGQHECGLIDRVVELVDNQQLEELQPCPIRTKCRWFHQRGGQACAQCNEMIRNLEAVAIESL